MRGSEGIPARWRSRASLPPRVDWRGPLSWMRCGTLTSEMDELQAIKVHLADLARNKPTTKRRDEVEVLLGHKWTGVQVQAANVLAAWGGPESVSALRRWQGDGRPSPLAMKLLGRCVGEDDVLGGRRVLQELRGPKSAQRLGFLATHLPTTSRADTRPVAPRGEARFT